ncbi:MAG: S8 family serine peptidase [Rhodospirillales bacterium]|nr:S8 family serine peptidase [Rhodospirillales bacterium]
MTIRVGLLDSGVGEALNTAVLEQKSFQLSESGDVVSATSIGDVTGHGTLIAQLILSTTPEIKLLSARVFSEQGTSTPATVAAGLDWLIEAGVGLACMSFGLHADRPVLEQSCRRASRAGVILVAAAPARGDPVYPAAYDNVIAVTGDARCEPGEFSHLQSERAKFGACAYPADVTAGVPGSSGASLAAAYAVREAAAFLSSHPDAQSADFVRHLTSLCRYHGAERRTG